ncbi:MAG: carboxymuconolactone decarboxylase family protein [Flavobacteriales bacterium]|nr:carboxymuconolactone decarboxylase family protein [Flavobacteriales bacterium]
MATLNAPCRAEVSENNQAIFDDLEKGMGFVPNIYAYFAKSETALADILAFQNRQTTLSAKEKEVIKLATSQINGCRYCQSAHSLLGKMNGFTDEEIIELRKGAAPFDPKFDALAKFTASIVNNRGTASQEAKEAFFAAGYNEANLVDVVIVVGDITISNYLNELTNLELDFPLAPEITLQSA